MHAIYNYPYIVYIRVCMYVYICTLLKALPPVCMVYTAQDESQVANIAQGKAECYICHETLTKNCIYHINEVAVSGGFRGRCLG